MLHFLVYYPFYLFFLPRPPLTGGSSITGIFHPLAIPPVQATETHFSLSFFKCSFLHSLCFFSQHYSCIKVFDSMRFSTSLLLLTISLTTYHSSTEALNNLYSRFCFAVFPLNPFANYSFFFRPQEFFAHKHYQSILLNTFLIVLNWNIYMLIHLYLYPKSIPNDHGTYHIHFT